MSNTATAAIDAQLNSALRGVELVSASLSHMTQFSAIVKQLADVEQAVASAASLMQIFDDQLKQQEPLLLVKNAINKGEVVLHGRLFTVRSYKHKKLPVTKKAPMFEDRDPEDPFYVKPDPQPYADHYMVELVLVDKESME